MANRINYSTGAKWEPLVGYSRAVRVGNVIEVSGTCAVDEHGNPFAPDDAYAQTVKIFQIINKAITSLGGRMEDIIRTRIYVTDINNWTAIGKAHGELFQTIRPVTTLIEVSKLISTEYLVEIEATVILND